MKAQREPRRAKGILQDVRNKFEKITAGVQQEATDLRDKVVNLGSRFFSKPKTVSLKVRNLLKNIGGIPMTSAEVVRTPVQSVVQQALNFVSGGEFKKALGDAPYDTIYHLRLIVTLENGKMVSIEKNAIITIAITKGYKGESMPVSVPSGLTINEALEKTSEAMGDLFATYSAKNNNCQDFILAFLKSNGMGDPKVYAFVKQNVSTLFGKSDFLRKFTNTVTDIGAKVSTLIEGEGASKSHVNKMNAWITHVKDVAAKKGISYREALRSSETKETYKKGKGMCMEGEHHMRSMSPPRHEMMESPMKEMKEKKKRVRKGKGIPTMESSQAMLAQDEQVRDLAPKVLSEEVVRKPRIRKAKVAM